MNPEKPSAMKVLTNIGFIPKREGMFIISAGCKARRSKIIFAVRPVSKTGDEFIEFTLSCSWLPKRLPDADSQWRSIIHS